jgi:hypothetical protein
LRLSIETCRRLLSRFAVKLVTFALITVLT